MAEPFRYISYGAGVQSTALLVMSALGLHGVPKADIAVFADTGDEPQWVYDTLKWYSEWSPIPVNVCRNEFSLSHELRIGAYGKRSASIPAFTAGADGRESMIRRQCTKEFKIEVIQKFVRRFLGIEARCKARRAVICFQGISLDEAHRMKPNRASWITNHWPLVDARLTRADCVRFLESQGLPVPRKSSCVFCPYHSDGYWRDLKDNYPEEFEKACGTDRAIRDMSKRGMRQPLFVHRSLVPLSEVKFRHEDQREMFGNECDGVCGV